MDFSRYYGNPSEKPLDNLVCDGGFCKIFRTIGCIGDSLSSGEFESKDSEGVVGYHDFYEYSWGQFMARTLGSKVYNFSRGGMTAKEFVESFCDKLSVRSTVGKGTAVTLDKYIKGKELADSIR